MTFGSLGYGPRAQSVLHCHGVLALRHGPLGLQLGPKRCRTKAGSRRTRAGWQLAVQKRRKSQGLELVSSRFRKLRLAVWGPSLPWCFSPATRSLDSSLDRSGAERKPAPGGHEQGGSWQCRNAGKVKVWS